MCAFQACMKRSVIPTVQHLEVMVKTQVAYATLSITVSLLIDNAKGVKHMTVSNHAVT